MQSDWLVVLFFERFMSRRDAASSFLIETWALLE